MINYSNIRDVHLEISSLCNASCSWCPRNFWGYPYNDGYPEQNFTLAMAQQVFDPKFIQQLESLYINGNFGDVVMNPEAVEIVRYFRTHNDDLTIDISTNGAARNQEFWQALAQTRARVFFCLDGLADTHHLYRQNTVWTTVIRNAETFIAAGGHAIWKFIRFEHNQHQIQECQQASQRLGFKEFQIVEQGRDTSPVFNQHGQLTHVLGKYNGETSFPVLFRRRRNDTVLLEDIVADRTPKKSINCTACSNKSIYVAANGEVSPCCWLGFYPLTYGHGNYHQAANAQVKPLINKNNAVTHGLEPAIQWFDQVRDSWQIDDYQQGRLLICDDNCGT